LRREAKTASSASSEVALATTTKPMSILKATMLSRIKLDSG